MANNPDLAQPLLEKKITNSLIASGFCTTIAISPSAINAYNFVKLIVLTLMTAAILIQFGVHYKKSSLRIQKSLIIVSTLFCFGLIVDVTLGNNTARNAIVGVYGRNNGALTYICLLTSLILANAIANQISATKILVGLSILGSTLSIYGLLQMFGFDFIDYGNTTISNPIFLTLGNTNFTSALMGMSLMATISLMFSRKVNKTNGTFWTKLIWLGTPFQISILYLSEATQGFLALGCGVAVFLFFLPTKFSQNAYLPIISRVRRFFGIVLLLFASLGVFGLGPLSILFASGARSLQDRYYHWVAGWSMFNDNLLFGVGLDSYGDWYRMYRTSESIQFRQTAAGFTNDAHNVYVQLGATGGLIVLVPFVCLSILILTRATKHIYKKNFSYEFLGLFSIWVVFQAQSLVSINQVGISIWGWIVGGFIINCANWDQDKKHTQNFTFEQKPQMKKVDARSESKVRISKIAVIGAFLGIFLSSFAFLELLPSHVREIQIKNAIISLDQSRSIPNFATKTDLKISAQKLLNLASNAPEPELRYACIQQLLIGGFTEEALEIAKFTAEQYPREFDAWDAVAFIYEKTGRENLAVNARKIQWKLDPLNPDLRRRFAGSN